MLHGKHVISTRSFERCSKTADLEHATLPNDAGYKVPFKKHDAAKSGFRRTASVAISDIFVPIANTQVTPAVIKRVVVAMIDFHSVRRISN